MWLEGLDNIKNNTNIFLGRVSICLLHLSSFLFSIFFFRCYMQASSNDRAISSVNLVVIDR